MPKVDEGVQFILPITVSTAKLDANMVYPFPYETTQKSGEKHWREEQLLLVTKGRENVIVLLFVA
jgi:hypothetical protein